MTHDSLLGRPGNGVGWIDERPEITLARETWDREGEVSRQLMIREVTRTGLRLVVVDRDGATWSPHPNPAAW
jgi:hypothetical protein